MESMNTATLASNQTQTMSTAAGGRSHVSGAEVTSLNLNHGFAITPGMFDSYVERDAQLGSDASNFAREQFEAQRLVNKKVDFGEFAEYVRKFQILSVENCLRL